MSRFNSKAAWIVIPARGGSVAVPDKNLQVVGGQTLIARTISVGVGLSIPVVVSTDSSEIASEAIRYGARIVMRPPEISGPDASTEDALLHVVQSLQSEIEAHDVIVLLQCTSPFIQSEWIAAAVDAVVSGEWDAAFTVYKQDSLDFPWALREDGSAEPAHAWSERKPRQKIDLPFRENGAVYACKVESLVRFRSRFGNFMSQKILPIVVGAHESHQIDTWEDLEFCRAVLRPKNSLHIRELTSYQFLVFDFDGVFTDNKVIVDSFGNEAVVCSRADSWGLTLLRRAIDEKGLKLRILIATTEKNPVVQRRADKLRIACYSGLENKIDLLDLLEAESGRPKTEIANATMFVCNDTNDLDLLKSVAFSIVPIDADPELIVSASLVLQKLGGNGFVREVTDMLCREINKLRVDYD